MSTLHLNIWLSLSFKCRHSSIGQNHERESGSNNISDIIIWLYRITSKAMYNQSFTRQNENAVATVAIDEVSKFKMPC